jgi:hypothetical protein
MKRQVLITVHTLLAAFTLPTALMFMITGALYTWGFKGGYDTETHEIALSQAVSANLDVLQPIAVAELEARGISAPEGKPQIKKYGSHFMLEWTGSSKDVILEPTVDPLVAKLTVKNTTWYRTLVQLHKAKGGTAFKVYAAGFAIALAMILLSGFVMAWQVPRLRRTTMTATILGIVTFVAVIWIS